MKNVLKIAVVVLATMVAVQCGRMWDVGACGSSSRNHPVALERETSAEDDTTTRGAGSVLRRTSRRADRSEASREAWKAVATVPTSHGAGEFAEPSLSRRPLLAASLHMPGSRLRAVNFGRSDQQWLGDDDDAV